MKRRFEEDATRKPQVRPWERAVFVIYALWSLVAIVEIVGRHLTGSSPLPGILADHNGNLAVSGFIIPFGLVAVFVRDRLPIPGPIARVVAFGIVGLASIA